MGIRLIMANFPEITCLSSGLPKVQNSDNGGTQSRTEFNQDEVINYKCLDKYKVQGTSSSESFQVKCEISGNNYQWTGAGVCEGMQRLFLQFMTFNIILMQFVSSRF